MYFTFSETEYMIIDTDVDGNDSEFLRNPCPPSAAAFPQVEGATPEKCK